MPTDYPAQIVSVKNSIAKVFCPDLFTQAKPGHVVDITQRQQRWLNCYIASRNVADHTVELYLGVNTRSPENTHCNLSALRGNCIEAQYTNSPILVVVQENGLLPGIFLIKELRRKKIKNVSCLVQSNDLLFRPIPSKFVLPELPPNVIAAVPLLEDLGVPSRIANDSGLPGCYEGDVIDLVIRVLNERQAGAYWEVYLLGQSLFVETAMQSLLEYPIAVQTVVLAH